MRKKSEEKEKKKEVTSPQWTHYPFAGKRAGDLIYITRKNRTYMGERKK
jgi:hypothetical protein